MIYENLSYDEYCECGEAVKKYRNEHFGDGWQVCDDDMTILFNSRTGEYCRFYVASDEHFEEQVVKGLLTFDYFVGDEEDKEYADKLFKDIKYHRVISWSSNKIVRLCEKRLYCSDIGCFGGYVLTADPANVVNL